MVNLEFPTYPNLPYPYSGKATSSQFIQQSLGSFFNQIFSEQGTIRGYTVGQVEELLQAYQDLNEVVASYCVKDIQVYHKQIWQPLVLQKSKLDMSPFVWEQNGAVFGAQPANDPYYSGQIFEWGEPKSPSQQVFTYSPSFTIGQLSLIANQVYAPSVYYIDGVDVTLGADNTLFFNVNPFNNPNNLVINIIGTGGVPTTYVDSNGVTQQDQLLVLWMYNVDLDQSNLYNNFGVIFDILQPSSEQYKDILKSFFNISVEGATVAALKSLIAYIGGVLPIIDPVETVQYVATNEYNKVVVTDKHVYLFDLNVTLLSNVVPGAVFYAGDGLTTFFSFYDNISQRNWWQDVFANDQTVALSSTLFLGNYKYQFQVPNSLQLITLSPDNVLYFPIEGDAADVANFEAYINEPTNKFQICEALGLQLSTNPAENNSSVPVNPLNFLFENFFQNNTSLFILNFFSADSAATFLTMYPFIRQYLPKHVYFLLLITINNPPDVYENLNGTYAIAAYPGQLFNADGSTSTGNIPLEAPYYYTNLPIRLFSLGKSPILDGEPLSDSVDSVGCNGVSGNNGTCIDGAMFTIIPAGATTRTIGAIKLIDFSQ